MNVLLIQPFSDSESTAGKYKRLLSPMPPISLAYLAAALREAGVDVTFYDDYVNGGDKNALHEAVKSAAPDMVGISAVTPTAPGAYACARFIRQKFPGVKIVMGNIHGDVFYESILRDGLADVVCLGEGERTIVEVARALEKGDGLSSVRGIAYLEEGAPRVTAPRPYIEDLDSLPFPAWDLFPLDRYKIFSFAVVKNPGQLVLGSRGCPYSCNFCSLKIMGQRRRRRSAKNIADEIEWLYDRFGYVQPSFIDPIFPIGKKEGLEFAGELTRRGLHKKIVWITETRVDLVDDELMEAMRESGLRRIMFGFEVGSQESLDSVKKSFDLETSRKAVRIARRAGVQTIGFFMLGVPGETPESIGRTIDFASELRVDFAKFTVFVPFPGTPIYHELLEKGQLPDHMNFERYTSYPSDSRPAIWLPEGISQKRMMALQKKAFFKFYFNPRTAFNQLFRVRSLNLGDVAAGLYALAR